MLSDKNKKKLRKLLGALDPESKPDLIADELGDEIKAVSERLSAIQNKPTDLTGIQDELDNLKISVLSKLEQLPTKESLEEFKKKYLERVEALKEKFSSIVNDVENNVLGLNSEVAGNKEELQKELQDVRELLNLWRIDILNKVENHGGGNMNRQMLVNGVDVLKQYTDVNLIGSITTTTNTSKKRVDIDFSSVGGVDSITGTTDQVIASSPTGAVTLSLPQSIATNSNVRFGKVTVGTTPLPVASWDYAVVDDQSNYFTIDCDSNFVTTFTTVTGNGSTQYFVFKIGSSERLRIANNGSLSSSGSNFSNTAPGYKATRAGGATVYLSPDGSTGFVGTQSNHPFFIYTNDTSRIGITTGGLVNIVANGSAATPSLTVANDTDTGIYGDGSDSLFISTNNTERVSVGSTGLVGIGTTGLTVSAKLHVVSLSEQLRVGYDTSNHFKVVVGSTGTANLTLTGTSPYFLFNNNVGIGTGGNFPATPQGKLEVTAGSGVKNTRWSIDQSNYLDLTITNGANVVYSVQTGGSTASYTFNGGTTFTVNQDFKLGTVGNGLYIKEGSNATSGVATLVGGTVVVNTTKVTANSRIYLTAQSLGTITVGQGLAVSARTAGTSFTILSQSAIDTSVVAWMIVEPA